MTYLRDPAIIPFHVFRARFTDAELEVLHSAKASNWQIDNYVSLALAQNAVNTGSATATAAKAALVAASVLTQQRADEIFGIAS